MSVIYRAYACAFPSSRERGLAELGVGARSSGAAVTPRGTSRDFFLHHLRKGAPLVTTGSELAHQMVASCGLLKIVAARRILIRLAAYNESDFEVRQRSAENKGVPP
jgi:hypothetical protein